MNFLEIFTSLDDFNNWDRFIEHCKHIEGLSDLERGDAIEAIQYLKDLLGEDFLNINQIDSCQRHLLVEYLHNFAPWTRRWITNMVKGIKLISNYENSQSLIKKISNKEFFLEVLYTIDLCNKLANEGFGLSFEPNVKVNGLDKRPDIRLLNNHTDEDIFCEFSGLRESEANNKISQIYEKFSNILAWALPVLIFSGRLYKSISNNQADSLIEQIKHKISIVKREKNFEELCIDGIIDVAITTHENDRLMEKWCKEKQLNIGSFEGPPIPDDDINRIRSKVKDKIKQLPENFPGIIAIKVSLLAFRDVKSLIDDLEETIFDMNNLVMLILYCEYLEEKGNTEYTYKNHHYIIKNELELITKEYILLFNKYCKTKISPNSFFKLIQAFQ